MPTSSSLCPLYEWCDSRAPPGRDPVPLRARGKSDAAELTPAPGVGRQAAPPWPPRLTPLLEGAEGGVVQPTPADRHRRGAGEAGGRSGRTTGEATRPRARAGGCGRCPPTGEASERPLCCPHQRRGPARAPTRRQEERNDAHWRELSHRG